MFIVGNRNFKSYGEAAEYCNGCDFNPDIITEEKENILYWYEYRLRGFSLGCQPRDFIEVDHNKGKFGWIAYNRQLTVNEINDYELKEVM